MNKIKTGFKKILPLVIGMTAIFFSDVLDAQSLKADSLALHKLDAFRGSWVIISGTKPDTVCRTQCQWSPEGRCLICDQMAFNGKDTTTDICVYAYDAEKKAYRFYIIYGSDQPPGYENLSIDGNTWTYYGQSKKGNKTVLYRTINFFNERKDEVSFKVQYSESDGANWITTKTGLSKKL